MRRLKRGIIKSESHFAATLHVFKCQFPTQKLFRPTPICGCQARRDICGAWFASFWGGQKILATNMPHGSLWTHEPAILNVVEIDERPAPNAIMSTSDQCTTLLCVHE